EMWRVAGGGVARGWPRRLGEYRKQREYPLEISRAMSAGARKHRRHVEVLRDRERRKHLPAFRHLPDAEIANAVAFPSADVDIAECDAAARRAMHARDRANERRLAGPIRADNGYDRSFVDVERHVVERLRVAMEDIEILDAQHQSPASAPR